MVATLCRMLLVHDRAACCSRLAHHTPRENCANGKNLSAQYVYLLDLHRKYETISSLMCACGGIRTCCTRFTTCGPQCEREIVCQSARATEKRRILKINNNNWNAKEHVSCVWTSDMFVFVYFFHLRFSQLCSVFTPFIIMRGPRHSLSSQALVRLWRIVIFRLFFPFLGSRRWLARSWTSWLRGRARPSADLFYTLLVSCNFHLR